MKRPAEKPQTRAMWDDVTEHMDSLRRYYFDVVAADRDEITLVVRPKRETLPAGFRPRGRR